MSPRVVCVLASVLAAAVCSAGETSLEAGLHARWTAAYNRGDAEALGSMYAADARLQQGYCPTVTGRDAIRAFWRDDLAEGATTTYLEIKDALTFEGALYVSGTYAVDIAATPAVAARRVGGTYSQIWRHDERTGWTIHRETWTNLACADIVVSPPRSESAEPEAARLETGTAI